MNKGTRGRTRVGKGRQPTQSSPNRAAMSTTHMAARPTGRSKLPTNSAHIETGTSSTEIDPADERTSRTSEMLSILNERSDASPSFEDFFPDDNT